MKQKCVYTTVRTYVWENFTTQKVLTMRSPSFLRRVSIFPYLDGSSPPAEFSLFFGLVTIVHKVTQLELVASTS